jgi:hypothetical protein
MSEFASLSSGWLGDLAQLKLVRPSCRLLDDKWRHGLID